MLVIEDSVQIYENQVVSLQQYACNHVKSFHMKDGGENNNYILKQFFLPLLIRVTRSSTIPTRKHLAKIKKQQEKITYEIFTKILLLCSEL